MHDLTRTTQLSAGFAMAMLIMVAGEVLGRGPSWRYFSDYRLSTRAGKKTPGRDRGPVSGLLATNPEITEYSLNPAHLRRCESGACERSDYRLGLRVRISNWLQFDMTE